MCLIIKVGVELLFAGTVAPMLSKQPSVKQKDGCATVKSRAQTASYGCKMVIFDLLFFGIFSELVSQAH